MRAGGIFSLALASFMVITILVTMTVMTWFVQVIEARVFYLSRLLAIW